MNTQQIILRVMLWSLTIAAVLGAATVVFTNGDWAGRVTTTGIVTGVACALLLPVCTIADRPKKQAAGLFWMAVVILELIGALLLIWGLHRTFGYRSSDQWIILSMILAAIAALLIVGVLKEMHGRFGRGPGWCAIGVITTTFICFQIYLSDPFNPFYRGYYWIEAGWIIFSLLGLAVLCYAGNDELPRRRWRHIGTVAAVAAWLLAVKEILDTHTIPIDASVFFCLCAIAVAIAHANLTLFSNLKTGQRWVRTATIIATSAAAAAVALMLTHHQMKWGFVDEDLLGRFAAAVGILTACGSLGLLVLTRMNAKTEFGSESESVTQIDLICPRCRVQQSMAPGECKCAHCDLRIEVRFEEPRCTTCEYLLVGLTGDVCPECGNAIIDRGALGTART